MKKTLTYLAVALMAMMPGFVSCGGGGDINNNVGGAGSQSVGVSSVTLNKNTITLSAGASETLTASVQQGNATNESMTWSSSNSSVASVNNIGQVRAISAGKVTVTAATLDGSLMTTCLITVTTAPSTDNWVIVSAGYFHTLAIKPDGSLWTWGSNGSGQLGLGDILDRVTPVQVGYDNDWVKASAFYWNTLAVKSDGSLWVWGSDGGLGALGLGDWTNSSTPTHIGNLND